MRSILLSLNFDFSPENYWLTCASLIAQLVWKGFIVWLNRTGHMFTYSDNMPKSQIIPYVIDFDVCCLRKKIFKND